MGKFSFHKLPRTMNIVFQWRRKLKNFEGTATKNFFLRGLTPSKTHRFWSIYAFCLWKILLPFLICLSFSSFFSICLHFSVGCPLTGNFRGDISTCFRCLCCFLFNHLVIDFYCKHFSYCSFQLM